MIIVSGSLAYDRIMNFDGFFRDHINLDKLHSLSVSFMAKKFSENFGGTAGNIAYNLSLLGEKTSLVSSVGKDFLPYQKWLLKNKIDLSLVQKIKNENTAGAYIITDKADCQITAFYPGAMGEKLKVKSANWRTKYKVAIQNSKISMAIVAAGNLDDMRVWPKVFRQNKIPYIFDPGQALPALSGKDLVDGLTGAKVFICNDYELAMTLKKTGLTKKELLEKVEIVVTTLGEKGSIMEVKNDPSVGGVKMKSYRIPAAKPKNTCDPTGAGDAYRAGLIKGLLLDLPIDKIGKLASVVSVYTVEKYGTQTHWFDWSALMKRYRENFKEELL